MRRRLSVPEAVTEIAGRLVFDTPKSHQQRSVPIPRGIADELAVHLAGKSPDDLVFTAPAGGVLRLENFRRRCFDPATAFSRVPCLRLKATSRRLPCVKTASDLPVYGCARQDSNLRPAD
jgi:hypothetical protein